MKIDIPYGRDTVEVHINDENFGEMVYPNKVMVKDEVETLMGALEKPIGCGSFDSFLKNVKNILIIVNDGTRPTPTAKVLDIIHHKIKTKEFKFIVATGIHRPPTEDEFRQIFGRHLETFRDRIFIHDAKKDEDMVLIGISKNGTEMLINKMAVEAHKILIIGSVEPHYFAGYTGGRKALLPGIASYKTIEQNHKLALKMSAQTLALDGNPVHEDMEDAIQKFKEKELFAIMTVLDREDRIYAATAGDITESLKAAIEKSNEVFSVEIKEKADIVLAVAPHPMDVDLYQSQKALDNAKLALNPNGILILVSRCRSGVGHDTFAKLLASAGYPQNALNLIEKKYVLGYHKAAKIAEIARWAQIWAVTSIDPALMRSIFIMPFRTVQMALDAAIDMKGREKILFMMAASMTVPKVRRHLTFHPRRFVHGAPKKVTIPDESVALPDEKIERLLEQLMEM